jgi:hypothetical protein
MSVNKRNSDRRKLELRTLSAVAEICETRALLSAATVSLPTVELPVADEELALEEHNAEKSECDEFVPELAICTMLPGDVAELADLAVVDESEGENSLDEDGQLVRTMLFITSTDESPVDGELIEEEIEYLDSELENSEPSWSYRTLTSEVEDSESVEEGVLEADLEIADETSEDIDPAWIYQSFVPASESDEFGDPVEDWSPMLESEGELDGSGIVYLSGESTDDVTTLEDFDPSWAYRGEVVDGEEVIVDEDSEAVEKLEKEESTADSETESELGSEEVTTVEVVDEELVDDESRNPIRTFGGPQFRGLSEAGELPMEILMSSSGISGNESIAGSESSPGVIQGSNAVIIPQAQGPFQAILPNVAAQTTSTPAIPLLRSQSTVLFADELDLGYVGTLIPPGEDDVRASSDLATDSALPVLESSLANSVLDATAADSSELDVLTPLLETETAEDEPVAVPGEEVSDENEEPLNTVHSAPDAAIETVTAESVHSRSVSATYTIPRGRSTRAIDSFMAEFSLSGFVG